MAAHEMDKVPANPPEVVAEPRRVVAVPVATPPALSATPDAMALLKALRRRWFLAGALGCLAALVTFAAAWYLLPAKSLANILLQVSARQPDGVETNVRVDHSMLMKTSADRIKSRDVLMRALNQDGVRGLRLVRKNPDTLSALMWMEENLKVDYREGSELLNITLTGEDPNDLTVIVGALAKAFLQIVNGEDNKQRKDRMTRYEKLYADAKEKLREKVDAKEALLGQRGAKDAHTLLQQQMAARFRLERAQEVLAQHQYELDKKNAKLGVLLKHKAGLEKVPAPEVPLKEVHEIDPELKLDVAKMIRLENTIDQLVNKHFHREDDYDVRSRRAELAVLKKKVEARVAEVRADIEAKVRKKHYGDVDAAILEMETEVAPLKGHIEKYQKDVEKLSQTSEEINFWTAKQNLLEGEILQQEKAVAELFLGVERARVAAEADPRITQIGEAEWQPRDVKKRILMLILAPLAALMGVVLAVGWWEFSARRIQDADEVVAGLAIRVVGAVPELPDPRRVHAAADPQAQELYRHNLIESIDAIRTMLLRSAPAENLRAVMVTSAVGGEGKTTLASNLAMSLARAGRKTLLIDCDLRRPSAHQLFEQTLQPGFSEVVLREVELAQAIRPTTTDPNLFLLPAGHWDREVIQELAKTGINGLFAELRQQFDFIVVDSHPVLPATDSLLIGQHVDAVIVSLMRDVSQVHHVHTACQQLSTLGIRVFGAVVNGVPVKVYGKGYQYSAQPVA
jgi:capsular exopolysaccharide synthesis family protein